MKYLFLTCLFFLPRLLISSVAVTENEPSALVEGLVNVITGDCYAYEEDILIPGAEPLKLKRSYISAKGEGKWIFLESLLAHLLPLSNHVVLTEPNGTELLYRYAPQKQQKHNAETIFYPLDLNQDASGLTNTARGILSGKTNLKNQHVSIQGDKGEKLLVHCANGTMRAYEALPNQNPETIKIGGKKIEYYDHYDYILKSESLPNGNQIIYDWKSQDGFLQSIRTTDPSGQKTYAQATFVFLGKIKHKHGANYFTTFDFDIHASDGRILQYRHQPEAEIEQNKWNLTAIHSSEDPPEFLSYHPPEIHAHHPEKNRGPLLANVSLPKGRTLYLDYYPSGSKSTSSRVKTLLAPVGSDATPLQTHHFVYHPKERTTIVYDAENIPIHYHWDENLRLTSIDRFSDSQTLHNSTSFIWGANHTSDAANLLCRTFFDSERKALWATRYLYDAYGNVSQEKFYGNLTGNGTFLNLDPNQFPLENNEVVIKNSSYSQDGKNLLLRQEEDNGKVTTYGYLPDTDLVTEVLTYDKTQIKKRIFYEYNADRILIREIQDDGASPDKNDLRNVKTRLIRIVHPYPHSPYLNMPYIIEEKYWDGSTEKLLKKTILSYTTGGKVCQKDIYDANDHFSYSLTYTYDPREHLIAETDALGQQAKYAYDELDNIIWSQDFNGKITQMTYDFSNRLTHSEETGPDLKRTYTYAYDKKHNKILNIDPYGNATHYTYTPFGQAKEIHLPPLDGVTSVIHSTYDSAGREILKIDAKGHSTQTHYNSYGKPTSIIYPDGTEEKWTYTLRGNIHTHTDQNGKVTLYSYDIFDNVTSQEEWYQDICLAKETWEYDAFGHLLAFTNAEGHTTTYFYDGAGRKIAEEINNEKIEYAYDSLGRLQLEQHDNLLLLKHYDLLNRVTEEKKTDSDSTLLFYTSYTYDLAGNISSITRSIDGKEATEHLTYDLFNRFTCKKDPLGNISQTLYDDVSHSETTIDPLGLKEIKTFNSHNLIATLEKRSSQDTFLIREEYTYDANDNLIHKQIHLPERTLSTFWEYDPLNRMTTLIEAPGTSFEKTTRYTYTPTGQIHQITKPSSTLLTHTYTPLQFLATRISSDGTIDDTFLYDRLGNLLESTDKTHSTTLYRTYDPQDRLLTERLPSGLLFKNTYDLQGRRTLLQLPDKSSIRYTYDPLYLRSIHRTLPSGQNYTHTYNTYDFSGNLLSQTHLNNLATISYTYDPLARPTSLTSSFFSHQVLYDPVGNITQAHLSGEPLSYTYDDLYQLTQEKGHTYAYDALYNRLQKDDQTFSLNALNQPTSLHYDPNGNLTHFNDTTYTYDALDRLITAETPQSKITFTYDALHRRLSKTHYALSEDKWILSRTTFYLYDNRNEIGASDGSHIFQLRILGNTPHAEINSAIALELHNHLYIPFHDLYGNIASLITDHTQEHYHYTAFGESDIPHSPTYHSGNPWRFSSKRTDDETGLIYFGRRYYIPSLGRWLTPDPLGFDASPNLYNFVSNDPLTHHDLYGLFDTKALPTFIQQLPTWEKTPLSDYKQTGLGLLHGAGDFAINTTSALSTLSYGLTLPFRAPTWLMGLSTPSQDWQNHLHSLNTFHSTAESWMQRLIPADRSFPLYSLSRTISSNLLDFTTLGLGFTTAAKGGALLTQRSMTAMQGTIGTLRKISRPPAKIAMPENLHLPKDHIWLRASPFRNKSAEELHEMFMKKKYPGFGKNLLNGYGNYINPKNARQYHIDPKNIGRYREPNHVDVSRPEGYKGSLGKKRFGYLDD